MKKLFEPMYGLVKLLSKQPQLLPSKRIFVACFTQNYSVASVLSSSLVKLNERSFTVHPGFGKLILNSECDCLIHSASSEDHPDSNYASVTIWGSKEDASKLKLEAELLGEDDTLKLEIESDALEGYCEIQMPLKYDIEADLENNASLRVEQMENDRIEISTRRGSTTTKNIKSQDISIKTDSGLITAEKVLQGNIFINAKETTLKANRLQGLTLHIQATKLDTQIESSYMDEGTIFAQEGSINIKHLHGSTNLHLERGNLVINGLHGGLQAILNKGDANVQVSEVKQDSFIQIDEGSLDLSFTDASNQNLDLSSSSIEIPSDMKRLGTEAQKDGTKTFKTAVDSLPCLRASVNKGSMRLSIKDWFSSLGIKSSA